MSPKQNGWRDLAATGGPAVLVIVGGVALQAVEAFIGSAMLPTVVREIGGLDLFAWNTTLFIVASIVASIFAAIRPAGIGPRGAYLLAATAFGAGSLICGLAPDMLVLLGGRTVQGFGAGLIVATTYAMLRVVFPQRLWPRAMALNAAIWGIATLLGPAIGGIFAQYGLWRWAFLVMVPASALLALSAWRLLPAASETRARAPLPVLQIFFVIAAMLDVSVASLLTDTPDIAFALVMLSALGIFLLGLCERYSRARLLPAGTFSLGSPLSALFATILVLGVSITSDIFAPLFLQRLHGLTPLAAGYLTALVAGGWSIAAILTSGWTGERARALIVGTPVIMVCATLGLWATLATDSTDLLTLLLASVALFALGAGIGMGFQHLSTRILAASTAEDNDRTSAALGMVQLFASGLGAAIGGVVVNAAGLPVATTTAEVADAARWLFLVFAAITALAIPLALRVALRPHPRLHPAQ